MCNEVNTNKSVDKLRMYFKKHKSESYPITEHPLEQADEYTKGIYITMLCTIMCNNSEPREEQRLFIERLMNGIGISGAINDYIKKVLEIDDKYAEEFIEQFKDNDLKCNFIVDALVLVSSVGSPEKKDTEFISEICDMFAISKDDIRIFSKMALGIVEQDSEKFIDSSDNNLILEKVEQFKYYYKDFFDGALIDNNEVLYFYANEKKELNVEMFFKGNEIIKFKEKTIVLENYKIKLNRVKFNFIDCHEIKFINCDFTGNAIKIEECENITIKKCEFRDFESGTLILLNCDNIFIEKSSFKRCAKVLGNMGKSGAIIYSEELKKADILECIFYECSLKTLYEWNPTEGVIFYGDCECKFNLKRNEFDSCKIITSNRGHKSLFYSVNNDISKIEDNKIINSNCELTN